MPREARRFARGDKLKRKSTRNQPKSHALLKKIILTIIKFMINLQDILNISTFFDMGLFQNVFLGMIGIFVPFAIILLSYVFNNENRESLVKKVLVKNLRKLFLWLLVGLITFVIFDIVIKTSGQNPLLKLLLEETEIKINDHHLLFSVLLLFIAIAGISIYIFVQTLKTMSKLLKYAEGKTPAILRPHLKHLKLNREDMKEAREIFEAIFSKKGVDEINSGEFVQDFIDYVDKLINKRKFKAEVDQQIMDLSLECLKNTEHHRNPEVFKSLLKWSEDLTINTNKEKDRGGSYRNYVLRNTLHEAIIIFLKKEESYDLFLVLEEFQKVKENEIKNARNENDRKRYEFLLRNIFESLFDIILENERSWYYSEEGHLKKGSKDFPNEWLRIFSGSMESDIQQLKVRAGDTNYFI